MVLRLSILLLACYYNRSIYSTLKDPLMSTITPDAHLTQRVQQAIATRDKARDIEIQMRTAAGIARQQANTAKEQAKELFGVDSLEELQAKTSQTYSENLAQVTDFENGVRDYVANVTAASKIGEGSKA